MGQAVPATQGLEELHMTVQGEPVTMDLVDLVTQGLEGMEGCALVYANRLSDYPKIQPLNDIALWRLCREYPSPYP